MLYYLLQNFELLICLEIKWLCTFRIETLGGKKKSKIGFQELIVFFLWITFSDIMEFPSSPTLISLRPCILSSVNSLHDFFHSWIAISMLLCQLERMSYTLLAYNIWHLCLVSHKLSHPYTPTIKYLRILQQWSSI